jgi:TetR/AcrR family transcriptional regulator
VVTRPSATTDRHDDQSAITRDRLIEAALAEFSKAGFEGTSTRAIAARAGCHQPQINYHFASKHALWEAAVGRLFAELALEVDDTESVADPVERFELMIRRFVAFVARRPELNRIMVAEAMATTPRLTWLVETYSRAAHDRILDTWRGVRRSGFGANIDERVIYHVFIGAASLLWANEPEAHLLDPSIATNRADAICAHADSLVAMLMPSTPDTVPVRTNTEATTITPNRKTPFHALPSREHRRPRRTL